MYGVNIVRQMWESPCEESTREEESEQNVNVRRCFGMCYLIAKNNQGGSSLAIQMMHGKELAKLKQKLLSMAARAPWKVALSTPASDTNCFAFSYS